MIKTNSRILVITPFSCYTFLNSLLSHSHLLSFSQLLFLPLTYKEFYSFNQTNLFSNPLTFISQFDSTLPFFARHFPIFNGIFRLFCLSYLKKKSLSFKYRKCYVFLGCHFFFILYKANNIFFSVFHLIASRLGSFKISFQII